MRATQYASPGDILPQLPTSRGRGSDATDNTVTGVSAAQSFANFSGGLDMSGINGSGRLSAAFLGILILGVAGFHYVTKGAQL